MLNKYMIMKIEINPNTIIANPDAKKYLKNCFILCFLFYLWYKFTIVIFTFKANYTKGDNLGLNGKQIKRNSL